MEQFVGEVRWFAFNYAPQNWTPCDGRLIQIRENQVLFALIGTTFGGDGRSTYALPTIADKDGLRANIATNGMFPSRP